MSRMTYLRSPLSNIRPRRGPWPNPGLCPPPKNPFIAFGPNMFSISFRKRCRYLPIFIRQLTPVLLPERVPDPSVVRPYLQVTALREIREHFVRLGDGERGLQSRERRRELPRRASAPRS